LVFLVVYSVLAFPAKPHMRYSSLHECYMPRPPHSPWPDHSNYIWRRVQVTKLRIVHFSLTSCYFTKKFTAPPHLATDDWLPANNSSPLVPILSHLNPVRIVIIYSFIANFNIILVRMPGLPSDLFPSGFPADTLWKPIIVNETWHYVQTEVWFLFPKWYSDYQQMVAHTGQPQQLLIKIKYKHST
jgi:hypothetical protein